MSDTNSAYANANTEILRSDLRRFGRVFKILTNPNSKKKSMFLRGVHGVGKSSIIYQKAMEQAIEMEREFVSFDRVDPNSILHIGKTPEEVSLSVAESKVWLVPNKHYVFYDIRISQRDFVDFIGAIDKVGNGEDRVTRFVPVDWVRVFSHPQIAGCLLLDEADRGSPMVRNAVFELVHDRRINASAISESVIILAAGNSGIGLDNIYDAKPMDAALTNRFWNIWLHPTVQEWLDWARNENTAGTDGHKLVADFIERNQGALDYPENQDHDTDTILPTRRGWGDFACAISTYLNDLKSEGSEKLDLAILGDLAAGFVGSTASTMFTSWYAETKIITWDDVLTGRYIPGEFVDTPQTIDIFKQALSRVSEMVDSVPAGKNGELVQLVPNSKAIKLAEFIEDIYENNREVASYCIEQIMHAFIGEQAREMKALAGRGEKYTNSNSDDGPLHHIVAHTQTGRWAKANPYQPKFSEYAKKRRELTESNESQRELLMIAVEGANAASEDIAAAAASIPDSTLN